jgi:CPA2 family monovalent cation:H+ antiporter-2
MQGTSSSTWGSSSFFSRPCADWLPASGSRRFPCTLSAGSSWDEFLSIGAEIGIVLLLLLLGLEYSPRDLRDGMRSTWLAGVVDIVLNGLPGLGFGLLLGWDWTTSILLAGVTYISSSGIIARLLHDLGRIANRETPVVLSLLVMEDIAMAVFLPVVAVLVIGASLTKGLVAIGVAIGVVILAFAVAFRLGDRVSRAIHSHSNELLILTILGITFLVAGIADAVQVSTAVGAFLLGVTLSGQVADRVRILLPPFRDVFGGFFFIFFGMRIDPATLPPVLVSALTLASIGVVTKIATGRYAASRAGLGKKARRRAGFSLVARGEFSIIIASLGVTAGLEPDLGPLAAAYVLTLAILGPLMMKFSGHKTRARTE